MRKSPAVRLIGVVGMSAAAQRQCLMGGRFLYYTNNPLPPPLFILCSSWKCALLCGPTKRHDLWPERVGRGLISSPCVMLGFQDTSRLCFPINLLGSGVLWFNVAAVMSLVGSSLAQIIVACQNGGLVCGGVSFACQLCVCAGVCRFVHACMRVRQRPHIRFFFLTCLCMWNLFVSFCSTQTDDSVSGCVRWHLTDEVIRFWSRSLSSGSEISSVFLFHTVNLFLIQADSENVCYCHWRI